MANKENILKNIKNGGSLVIYIGTASIVRPLITKDNDTRNAVGKMCSLASGTVISCGIANYACKFFGNAVDKVAEFIEDVWPKKKKEDSENAR